MGSRLRIVTPQHASPSTPEEEDAFSALWTSFVRALRAENASPRTIRTYAEGAEQFHAFLWDHGYPIQPGLIQRQHVDEFLAGLVERRSPATVRARFSALRRWFNWLVEEEEMDRSPMERIRGPKVPDVAPDVLGDDELRRLFKACTGSGFDERRDTAILSLLLDCGLRRSELASLSLDDINLNGQLLRVIGKGGHEAGVPFGSKAARDVDRYLRVRALHSLAATTRALWLAQRGPLSSDGVYQMVERRAKQAGIDKPIHPHQFRHTFANAWLRAGGTEGDLMRLGRWRDAKVMRRYGSSLADRRAWESHRRLSPRDHLS